MRYDQIGTQPPVRVACDRPDWPAEGPGWVTVAADSENIDVVVVGGDAQPGALDMPLVLAATDDVRPELIDAADAILFADDTPEVVGAILRQTCDSEQAQLRERGEGTALISALSAEAARIADALARLAEAGTGSDAVSVPVVIDARLVRAIIRLRRERERHFPAEIFADPAWDMMLDLAAARLEGQPVSVSSLCIASAVPTTTALRWIRSLSQAGIFVRSTDIRDARRTWIGLSDTAAEAVMAWLRRFALVFAPA